MTRRATISWSLLFGFLCLLMLVVGLETALHFLGPAIDGPFQLYNSLRRISVGQRPGVDWQFFHGVLIPYLHYPLFRLLGGAFAGSELSREIVSTVLYPLTVVVFLKLFIKDWDRTIAWAAIVMAASIALRLTSVLVAINSLLGIRSTLPVMLAVVLCLPVRRAIRSTLAALTIGGALLLGTEQGLATIAALVVATVVVAIRSSRRRDYVVDTTVAITGGVATLVIVLTMLGGYHGMLSAIQYNFKSVPMDQYWYFGVPPNRFLSSWRTAPAVMASLARIPVVLAIGTFAAGYGLRRAWRGANTPLERREFAFGALLVYGLLSCASLLGTWANAYVQAELRVLLLVAAVYLSGWLPARDTRMNRPLVAGVGRSALGLAIATVLIMIAIVPSVIVTTVVTLPHFIKDHVFGGQRTVYAGIWPSTIPASQAILDSRRGPNGETPTLWSTYAGLLEARNGMFHPTTDYIIHALGPANRRAYVDDFRRLKPRLVQTVHPLYTQYESWIEQTSWDFYAELLRNYDLVGNTEWSLFWERRAQPLPAPSLLWSTQVRPDVDGVQLPPIRGAGAHVLFQVEMDYEVRNPLGALPVIGAMPRYLVVARNALQKDPVTLNPYVTQMRFPLIAIPGKSPELHWGVFGLLPGASLTVKAIRIYMVPTSGFNRVWFDALVEQQSRVMTQ